MSTIPISQDSPWLAPLAGYSDLPFRLLCREYGASVACTEMVSSKGLMYDGAKTKELLQTIAADSPLVVQLFGSDVESLEKALIYLVEHDFNFFDLNMGCSVPKVNRSGSGSAMLKDMEQSLKVAKAMINIVGKGRMGFKMRLGWDDNSHIWQELPLRLQDLGAAWITLHPRTARQKFSGKAHWPSLKILGQMLDIPLIASGDLLTAKDGINCLEQTNVNGLMYARGAMYNPAIFREHNGLLQNKLTPQLGPDELLIMIKRHIALTQSYSSSRSALPKMRSIVPRYVHNFHGASTLRRALSTCESWAQLDDILENCLQKNEDSHEDSSS